MRGILSHAIVAVVTAVLMFFVMQCGGRVTTVTQTETVIDTVYQEVVVERIDTFEVVKWRTRTNYDTIQRIVEVPVEDTTSGEKLYTYNELYRDSMFEVAGNIEYEGRILRHDQILIQKKDYIQFIERDKHYYHNRDVIKRVTSYRQPRLLGGVYTSFDGLEFQQLGAQLTLVDNQFRQYTVGKHLFDSDSWTASIQIPLLWK